MVKGRNFLTQDKVQCNDNMLMLGMKSKQPIIDLNVVSL